MKRLTLFFTACLMAVLAALVASVRAQQFDTNDRTFMTFSSNVELPGVTLEPGTYEFRLAPMTESRNVVQVLKKDDSKVIGQWTFAPAERERTSEETVVMFKEAREGSTPAVQYWFYPGEKIGKEFIYPKDQAQRIADRTGQNVRSDSGTVTAATAANRSDSDANRSSAVASAETPADSQVASDLRNAQVTSQPSAAGGSLTGNRGIPAEPAASAGISTDNPPKLSASAEASAQTPPTAQPSAPANREVAGTSGSSQNTPTDRDVAQSSPRSVGTSGEAQAPTTPASELPKTASPLPMSALIGALSLMAALSLRALRA